jgi:hypothetical protein
VYVYVCTSRKFYHEERKKKFSRKNVIKLLYYVQWNSFLARTVHTKDAVVSSQHVFLKFLFVFLVSLKQATCPIHFTPHNLTVHTTFGERYKQITNVFIMQFALSTIAFSLSVH